MLQEKEKKESYLVSMNEPALLLQFHWPELYHMATLKLQGRLGKREPRCMPWRKRKLTQ